MEEFTTSEAINRKSKRKGPPSILKYPIMQTRGDGARRRLETGEGDGHLRGRLRVDKGVRSKRKYTAGASASERRGGRVFFTMNKVTGGPRRRTARKGGKKYNEDEGELPGRTGKGGLRTTKHCPGGGEGLGQDALSRPSRTGEAGGERVARILIWTLTAPKKN